MMLLSRWLARRDMKKKKKKKMVAVGEDDWLFERCLRLGIAVEVETVVTVSAVGCGGCLAGAWNILDVDRRCSGGLCGPVARVMIKIWAGWRLMLLCGLGTVGDVIWGGMDCRDPWRGGDGPVCDHPQPHV